ncbi:hypothetical protein LWI29_017654 [Acer saccharum]|uniref:Uncharacterized protein n=1 Tax=Acer saccharum TaxID=4024 RepID=A0AA39SES5_ACESA|nr:hypothetical protein LWI29_017654 [Acer saccharum]
MHFLPSSPAFSSRSQELQSGEYIVRLLLPHCMDSLWNTTQKVPAILPDPSIKWYVQNHLGYDLNFKAPTDVGKWDGSLFEACHVDLSYKTKFVATNAVIGGSVVIE